MSLIKLSAAMTVAVLATGCASIVNDTTQPIRIDTVKADGTEVSGAECKLTNDYGTSVVKSGTQGLARRSSKDLDIVCVDPTQPEAKARAISRANAGLAGNIIFGGGIGAIIDHNKGTAYTYPTWMRIEFGKAVVVDRSDEKEGKPVSGREQTPTTTAAK